MERIIITGSSGFIGNALALSLLKDKYEIVGIDNMNQYYDVNLKKSRLEILKSFDNFKFVNIDISAKEKLENVFKKYKPSKVINLAAQAGVRYSLINPQSYIKSNIVGFANVLECARIFNIEGLIYASSSSVYGNNKTTYSNVKEKISTPLSLYAATKSSNELMAYAYNNLYGLKSTGLRFFTCYGPWGRPDMAIFIFSKNIINGEPIELYNYGNMERDFTYVDDVIMGIRSSIDNNYDHEIFNLGNNKSENVKSVIKIIENYIGKKAEIHFKEIQPGEIKSTCADIDYTIEKLDYNPRVTIKEGIPKFIDWYNSYYH
tara:strand:- start:183 stop:1136 length:954 start_codon:yes stop_codon:yes gene_type:complete